MILKTSRHQGILLRNGTERQRLALVLETTEPCILGIILGRPEINASSGIALGHSRTNYRASFALSELFRVDFPPSLDSLVCNIAVCNIIDFRSKVVSRSLLESIGYPTSNIPPKSRQTAGGTDDRSASSSGSMTRPTSESSPTPTTLLSLTERHGAGRRSNGKIRSRRRTSHKSTISCYKEYHAGSAWKTLIRALRFSLVALHILDSLCEICSVSSVCIRV